MEKQKVPLVRQRLFVGNFEFEHRLGPRGERYALPPRLARLNAELATVWLAVADDGDLLWTPEPIAPRFFAEAAACGLPRVSAVTTFEGLPPGLELVPWGWTADVLRRGLDAGCHCDAPPLEAVAAVNARSFSASCERDFGTALEGAATLQTRDELEAALGALPAGCEQWLLKAQFGMSGRERLLGRGRRLTAPARAWAERRMIADGVVFLEPWLDAVAEAGVQLTVPPTGAPRLEGVTTLMTEGGVYRGSRFSTDTAQQAAWDEAIEVALRVAQAAQRFGYFGPLGIDAMRYRAADGSVRLRPIQDVNARWTMGRLALGLRRLLGPGESGTWYHVPHSSLPTSGPTSAPGEGSGGRTVAMTPAIVGERPPRLRTYCRLP